MTAGALPPTAATVDRELARLDAEVDWLLALSPIQNDVLWKDFQASGFQRIGPLRYAPVHLDLHATREELLDLPVEDIESPVLSALLSEKQRELDRQIEQYNRLVKSAELQFEAGRRSLPQLQLVLLVACWMLEFEYVF